MHVWRDFRAVNFTMYACMNVYGTHNYGSAGLKLTFLKFSYICIFELISKFSLHICMFGETLETWNFYMYVCMNVYGTRNYGYVGMKLTFLKFTYIFILNLTRGTLFIYACGE